MNGSVLSRRFRFARTLPSTAMLFGLLAALPSCAGKAGQESGTPQPKKEAPSAEPKPVTAEQPKPAEPAPAPAPAQPVAAADTAAPAVIDSTAIAAEFCKKITDGVKAAIKADSSVADPDAAVRKIATSVPEATADVALAKNTTCR